MTFLHNVGQLRHSRLKLDKRGKLTQRNTMLMWTRVSRHSTPASTQIEKDCTLVRSSQPHGLLRIPHSLEDLEEMLGTAELLRELWAKSHSFVDALLLLALGVRYSGHNSWDRWPGQLVVLVVDLGVFRPIDIGADLETGDCDWDVQASLLSGGRCA